MIVNPLAVLVIAWTTVIGALLGHVLVGLAIGLSLVLLASLLAHE
jgi:hypothetical protein